MFSIVFKSNFSNILFIIRNYRFDLQKQQSLKNQFPLIIQITKDKTG